MEVFYQGCVIVQQFITADAKLAKEVALPRPPERQVAKYLADRRSLSVLDVVETLRPLSQPELLETMTQEVDLVARRDGAAKLGAVIAPKALEKDG